MPDYASTTTIQALSLTDKSYPDALKNIYNPPKRIFVTGEIPAQIAVAIVGSRKPTAYGEMIAYKIASDLAKAGVCIVSGLAYGIDSIVHRSALEAGGKTIAVLGSGLNNIYPSQHKPLAREIIRQGGAIISEYSADTPPLKHHFPARNRIIAGLSQVVIVAEADARSGSLITAQLALDESRFVMAVPGPITSPRSAGPNNLLKAGASVITSASDVFSLLGIEDATTNNTPQSTTQLSKNAKKILIALQNAPLTTEELASTTDLSISNLLSTLTLLELQNTVQSINGNAWMTTINI